jgi:hypothetical protein
VPVIVDHDDCQESRRQQLLALRHVRRNLERRTAQCRAHWSTPMGVDRVELARELHELIAALDRRVPRVEQAGEASIARDAAVLRDKARKRLEELEGQNIQSAPAAAERAR